MIDADDLLMIKGTQFVQNQTTVISMPNFTNQEFIFSNEVAMCGYKIYYNDANLKMDFMLFETQLTDVLLCRDDFLDSENEFIFRMLIRMLMNMIPTRLDLALYENINASNFLQPIELLDGNSMCTISLPHPFGVLDQLN